MYALFDVFYYDFIGSRRRLRFKSHVKRVLKVQIDAAHHTADDMSEKLQQSKCGIKKKKRKKKLFIDK